MPQKELVAGQSVDLSPLAQMVEVKKLVNEGLADLQKLSGGDPEQLKEKVNGILVEAATRYTGKFQNKAMALSSIINALGDGRVTPEQIIEASGVVKPPEAKSGGIRGILNKFRG